MTSAGRPPTFARSGSSSLTTTSFYSQPAIGSFTATAESIASTPQGTPPPPHLNMNSQSEPPAIYSAVYSGVSVFEMTVNNVAVMRRRDDNWLNATQILKVAGVEKGKRTKVLEKEILAGKHEKVQGGYGKYQGTWIDFQRGREFCRAYGVEDLLAPLLDLDVKANGGLGATPTKEQAMAAKRKRMYNSSLAQSNGNPAPVFPNISPTVTNAFTALSKANVRVDSPGPRGSAHMPSQGGLRHEISSQDWHPTLPTESSYLSQSQNAMPDSAYASQVAPPAESHYDTQEPPRKRPRASTPADNPAVYGYHDDSSPRPLPPLNIENIADYERVRETMMNLFIYPEGDVNQTMEGLTAEQVDIPLDHVGSAAMHWAASLARVPLIRALIARGASIYRVNSSGETALVRGCFCTNNFDQNSFPQLLNLLHPTISIADNNGRTILHHIALKSGMKGRSADGRYYLHCLLEFVAKHGASSSNRGVGPRVMNLAKFITEIVNAQDKCGDTALNIAARIGNRSIVQQLLEVGADSSIPNRAGLRPVDFGVGGEPGLPARGREQPWTLPPAVVQKREDIVHSMQETIAGIEKEFEAEIQQKKYQHDALLTQLRMVSQELGNQRENMNRLRKRSREHADLRQHIQNLKIAIDEEKTNFQEHFGTTNGDIEQAVVAVDVRVVPPNGGVRDLTPQQRDYLVSLPSSAALKARLRAYRINEELLRDKATKLHDRSSELEGTFRRVVALCTGVPEDRVDSLLEGLVQAVESDPGEVDTARVTSFLRKVDESIGSD